MARNPYGSDPGGGGSSAPVANPYGSGGGRVRAQAPAAKPKQKSHGGIGGLLGEAGQMVKKFPGATMHLGKDVGTEATSFAKHAPGDVANAFTHPLERPSDVRGETQAEKRASHPFSSGIAESFERTGHRVTHPGEYVQAYREGHLLGSVLEDVGNAALVGGVASKGLDIAAQGTLSEAEGARVASENLTNKVIPEAEKRVAEQQARVAEDAALVGHDGRPLPEAYTQHENAKALLDQLTQTLDEHRAAAAREAARADELLSGKNAALIRAHRVAQAVERFGAKGANAPATPFVVGAKVLGKAVETLFKVTPGLDQVLAKVADWSALHHAHGDLKARVAAAADDPAADTNARSAQYSDAVNEMAKTLGGDDDLLHAALLDLHGATQLMGDGLERIRRTAGPEMADRALAGIAQHPELRASANALDLATKLERGELPAAVEARIRRAQAVFREKVLKLEEERYLADEGGARRSTPEQQANREWQVHGNEANPAGRQELEARHAAEMADAQVGMEDRAAAVEKAKARITIDPAVMADLPAAVARNVELALSHAENLVDQAFSAAQAGDTALLEELRAIPGVKGATRDDLVRSLAKKIEQAAGSLRLERKSPLLREAVETTGMERLKIKGMSGRTRRLEAAAKAEAKATEATAHAKRLQAAYDRLKGSKASRVESVVKSVENLTKAKSRVEAKLAKAAEARRRIAAGHEAPDAATAVADLKGEVRDARQRVVDAAKAEASALDDTLPPSVPYVPGGISPEYHDALVDRLGGQDWSIGDEMRRYRDENPRSGLSDEAVFKRLYAKHWQGLPKIAKETLTRLTDQEMSVLYGRWSRGEITPDLFSLDEAVTTFAGDAAGGAGREAAYTEFLDAMERRAGLRRIVKSGPRDGFYPEDLQRFYAAIHDPEVAALARDETMQAVLQRGRSANTLANAAEHLLETRASASRLPDLGRLASLFDDESVPLDEALFRSYPDEALGDEVLTRWQAAGEPDLEQSIRQMLNGETPEWLAPGAEEGARAVARSERRAGAANELDSRHQAFLNREVPTSERPGYSKLTPDEKALADAQAAPKALLGPQRGVERAVEAQGGAERVRGLLSGAETAAERARAAMPDTAEMAQARAEAAGGVLSKAAVKQIADHGGQIAKYRDALRELKFSERRLERLPEKQAQELIDYSNQIKNASARWRAPLQELNAASDQIGALARELEQEVGVDPVLLDVLNDVQVEWAATLADLTREGHFVAGPGGKTVPMEPRINPTYVPGGRIEPRVGEDQARTGPGGEVKLNKSAAERERKTAVVANTAQGLHDVLMQRARREGMNEVAHNLDAHLGIRPAQAIGADRATELAETIRDAEQRATERIAEERAKVSAMEKGEAKSLAKVQLKERIARINRETAAERAAAARTLIEEMDAAGYQPWNPRNLFPSQANPKGLGTVLVTDPAHISTSTLWLPKGAAKIFDDMYRGPGAVERMMRKTWDPATNAWKTLVLPLSPRWQAGNAVGNFVMATLGGGIDPVTWAHSMRDATAVLRKQRLTPQVENPEAFGLAGRSLKRATSKLAKAEQRVGRLDEATRASITDSAGRTHLNARLMQKGGAAGHDPYLPEKVSVPKRFRAVREAAHTIIEKSYAANSFVDNLNRVAVYLAKHKAMSAAEVSEFAARNPHLAAIKSPAELRDAAAVKLSLDAVGDFQKMTRTERQVIRRVVPFYAWLKHITTLAVKLPLHSPVRVAWFLHLSDVYGGDQSNLPAFLAGSIPGKDDNTFWRLPRINPLEDVVVLPSSGDPREVIKAGLGSVGPIPRLGAAALLGFDTRTGLPIRRAPGTGTLDAYGNPTFDPLLFRDPKELAGFLAGQTPQTSIGRAALDTVEHGSPRLRYPTGQPYKSSTGQTYPGDPLLGQIAAWAGVPHPQRVDVARIQSGAAAKQARNAAAKARYQRKPAPAGASSRNPYG